MKNIDNEFIEKFIKKSQNILWTIAILLIIIWCIAQLVRYIIGWY